MSPIFYFQLLQDSMAKKLLECSLCEDVFLFLFSKMLVEILRDNRSVVDDIRGGMLLVGIHELFDRVKNLIDAFQVSI